MHRRMLATIPAATLAISVLMTSSADAQTTAAGPYYATPSWDQTLPAATRFVVLSNFNSEAVLDRETGLTWARNQIPAFVSYDDAQAACAVSKVGGRYGWRIPTPSEFLSLFDPATTTFPFLPVGHPFGPFPRALNNDYWTSTPARTTGEIVTIDLNTLAHGPQWTSDNPDIPNNAICVRGPG